MRTLLLLFSTILVISTFGQGAGNYMINQRKSSSGFLNDELRSEERNFGGYNNNYNANNNYYQTQSAYSYTYYNDTTIQISVRGLMNTSAESYIAVFGLAQTEETIESCHELINKRIQTFVESLKELGINKEEVYVDFISQVPIFEYELEKKMFSKTYNEIPAGFEVKKNIHIKFKNPEVAEKLLILAAKNEIYDVIKVDYILADIEKNYDTLRNECIRVMNEKVADFKKLGISFVSDYKTVSESQSCIYPIERYSPYRSFNEKSTSTVKKDGKRIPKADSQVTIFYDKLPAKNYDIVINPDPVKHPVQLTYSVTMRFVLKKQ